MLLSAGSGGSLPGSKQGLQAIKIQGLARGQSLRQLHQLGAFKPVHEGCRQQIRNQVGTPSAGLVAPGLAHVHQMVGDIRQGIGDLSYGGHVPILPVQIREGKLASRLVLVASGWNILLKAGTNRGPLVDACSKEPQLFKPLDAVVWRPLRKSAARSKGCARVDVHIGLRSRLRTNTQGIHHAGENA